MSKVFFDEAYFWEDRDLFDEVVFWDDGDDLFERAGFLGEFCLVVEEDIVCWMIKVETEQRKREIIDVIYY